MHVLVTGGAGFIGTNLVAKLLGSGHSVSVIDDLSAGSRPDWWGSADVRCLQGTIQDPAAVREAVDGVEAIVHLAARPGVADSLSRPELEFGDNVLGTFVVFDEGRRAGVGRMVFASSTAVLAGLTPPLREDMPPSPTSPYGASKLYGEGLMLAAAAFGMTGISVRMVNVYGPHSGHKKSLITSLIGRVLRDEPLVILGSGEQTRDFLHVEDACSAIELVLREGDGGVHHIGTGTETSVLEVARAVSEACGRPLRVTRLPAGPGPTRSFVDPAQTERALGWRSRVSLAEGLERTVGWMRAAAAPGQGGEGRTG